MEIIKVESGLSFQGDVGILKLPEGTDLPKGLKKASPEAKGMVLAHGEATGHAHAFENNGAVELYYNPDTAEDSRGFDEMYFIVHETSVLVHDEHTAFSYPPGIYKKWLQKEYNFEGEYRRVAD